MITPVPASACKAGGVHEPDPSGDLAHLTDHPRGLRVRRPQPLVGATVELTRCRRCDQALLLIGPYGEIPEDYLPFVMELQGGLLTDQQIAALDANPGLRFLGLDP